MIKQSDLALAAWQSTERLLDAVVTINKIDYKTTDLTSIDYDSGGFTGDTFSVGSNYENSVSIKFAHLVEGLKAGMTLVPKVGIKTASGYEYSSLGVFVISDEIQMDRNNDETTIKAYDQMCLMEGTYTSKLSYPARAVDVIAEIANMAGVALNTSDISRLPTLANIPSAINGQTYRNAIGMMAQFYAGFTTFDRDGKLTIRVVTEPDYVLGPSQYEQGGLTKNEAPYKIGGIQCDVTTSTTDSSGSTSETTTTLQVGATSGSQVKLANNLMTMDRLQDIWTQIKDITFYPFSLTWFGNPAIEAGDWLTLQDTKGNKFNVPNNGYTMTFDGSLSAVSKADQTATSSSSYAWRGPLSQYVADLGGRQGASGNYIYGADTTDPPFNAKFNDLWYKQNGNKTEMWTYERQSDGTGKWVLTVSDLTGTEVAAKVAEAGKDAKTAVDSAETAVATANANAVKVNDTNVLSNNALTTAIDAQAKANVAVTAANSTAASFGKVEQTTESALANALSAQSSAGDAVKTANSTAASFGKVEQTAESALANALSAQSDAGSAVKSATSAATDSKDAKEIAGAVNQSYKTLTDGSTMTIAELENGVATKLTKTDLDGYATQTWTQNQIKVTADGINATLSSVKSTVDGQTTSINDLKADSKSFKGQFTTVTDALGKQTTDIATLQGTSKTLTSNIQSLTTDNQVNKTSISNLQQTATSLNSTIMAVQTQVHDSSVGTNLLLNAGNDNDASHPVKMLVGNSVVNGYFTRTAEYSQIAAPPSTATEMFYRFGDPSLNTLHGLEPGVTYTIQGEVVVSKGNVRFRSQRVTTGGWANYDTGLSGVLVSDSKDFIHVNYTFTVPSNATALYISWQVDDYDSTTVLKFRRMKLEKGSVATDFSVNPEDTATVSAFSKLSQTVDGMQLDIARKIEQSDLSGYATQTWTSNQISVTAGTINAELAKVATTVSGHTTSINSLTADASGFKTQITGLQVTNGKNATDIATLQGTSKTLTSNIQSLTTDNLTNKNSISNLQQTATTLSSTLMTVQTTVQNSAVGNNLLRYAGDFSGLWSLSKYSSIILKDDWGDKVVHYAGKSTSTDDGIIAQQTFADGQLHPNTWYTANFWARGSGDANSTGKFTFYFYAGGSDQYRSSSAGADTSRQSSDTATVVTLASGWQHYSIQFHTPANITGSKAFLIRNDVGENSGSLYCDVWHPKLELGQVATDFSTNLMDNATVTALAAVSQTVDGMKLDIAKKIEQSDLAGYATQTWTSNQINVTAGTINAELAKITTTVSGHTTSINSLTADASGFKTQISGLQVTNGKNVTDIATLQGTSKTLTSNIQSLTTDNQTNKTNISNLQQTATSLNSTIMTVKQNSATITALTAVSQTVSSLSTTVQGKVDNTTYQNKVTQLSNQLTSKISYGEVTNENLVPYSGYWSDTTGWVKGGAAAGTIGIVKHSFYHSGTENMLILHNIGTSTSVEDFLIGGLFPIERNTTYTLTYKMFSNYAMPNMDVWLLGRPYGNGYANNQSYTITKQIIASRVPSNSGIETITQTFTTGAIDEGYLRFDNNGNSATNGTSADLYIAEIKIEKGSIATPYTRLSGSEMVQTVNDINLRVTKNGVVNAINVSTEGIQIYGNKLHITAATYIDNAVIKTAMIDSITADKITAGTLNGNNVNVINLNASYITTGTLTGTNLRINLGTGVVTFQSGRIHDSANTIDINIDQGYVSVANDDARVLLKGGEIQFVEPMIFDEKTNPYLRIANTIAGSSLHGAAVIGREVAVLTNSANSASPFMPLLGVQQFSGISTGGVGPTLVGGANRGVDISGGTSMDYPYTSGSPYIRVGVSYADGNPGNRILMDAQYIHMFTVYAHTTSQSANVVVSQDGALVRSTSASKYKTNIVRGFSTDYGEKLIDLPTATWIDKASLERYNEDPTQPVPGLNYGMIAEDLAAAGVEKLVVRNENGGLEGIQYDRIAVALLPLIKNMKQRIDELEEKLA